MHPYNYADTVDYVTQYPVAKRWINDSIQHYACRHSVVSWYSKFIGSCLLDTEASSITTRTLYANF